MFEILLYVIYAVTAFLLIIMAVQLRRNIRSARSTVPTTSIALEADLPSVTVCIPARNEQHALTETLERVVASTYEKLETLVLDDDSVDDTSILIKSFAHAGVRFIKGETLPEGWLGRNYAMQQLLSKASGSYLLFMDVDTRLSPKAIEHLVRYALSKHAAMVSVVPRREDGFRASVFMSPLRFFWEILFHRKNAPATASNAWLINREVLEHRLDGFTSQALAIQPEAYFAKALIKTNEYRFLMGTSLLGVAYEKKWRSQLDSSVRSLFPLLGAQFSLALIVFFDLLLLLIPAALSVVFFITDFMPIFIPALIIHSGFAVLYGMYARTVWRRGWIIGAIMWPIIVLQETILVIISAIQHKRDAVIWKGRAVTPSEASL